MNAVKREELGKQANNKIRKDGLVPAVVYGRNKKNINILQLFAHLVINPRVILIVWLVRTLD